MSSSWRDSGRGSMVKYFPIEGRRLDLKTLILFVLIRIMIEELLTSYFFPFSLSLFVHLPPLLLLNYLISPPPPPPPIRRYVMSQPPSSHWFPMITHSTPNPFPVSSAKPCLFQKSPLFRSSNYFKAKSDNVLSMV